MKVQKIDTLKTYLSQTMSYQRESCQGYLRKEADQEKKSNNKLNLWSKVQDKLNMNYQRYFCL